MHHEVCNHLCLRSRSSKPFRCIMYLDLVFHDFIDFPSMRFTSLTKIRFRHIIKVHLQSDGREEPDELAKDGDARNTREMSDIHLDGSTPIISTIMTTPPYHCTSLVQEAIPHAVVVVVIDNGLQHLMDSRVDTHWNSMVIKSARLNHCVFLLEQQIAGKPCNNALYRGCDL